MKHKISQYIVITVLLLAFVSCIPTDPVFRYDGEHDIVYNDEEIFFCEFGDSVWSNSNRVKTLSVESKDTSEQWNFSLRDGYAALISEREWEGANSVGNVRLFSPGRCRMKPKVIYKGDKGLTTGLSEMWFYSVGTNVPLLYEMISKDKADKHQIFQNVLTMGQWRGQRGYEGELYSQTDSLYIVLDSVFKSYPNGTIPNKTIPEGEEVAAELFAILKKYRGDTRFSDYSTFVYGKEVAPDTLSADTQCIGKLFLCEIFRSAEFTDFITEIHIVYSFCFISEAPSVIILYHINQVESNIPLLSFFNCWL